MGTSTKFEFRGVRSKTGSSRRYIVVELIEKRDPEAVAGIEKRISASDRYETLYERYKARDLAILELPVLSASVEILYRTDTLTKAVHKVACHRHRGVVDTTTGREVGC